MIKVRYNGSLLTLTEGNVWSSRSVNDQPVFWSNSSVQLVKHPGAGKAAPHGVTMTDWKARNWLGSTTKEEQAWPRTYVCSWCDKEQNHAWNRTMGAGAWSCHIFGDSLDPIPEQEKGPVSITLSINGLQPTTGLWGSFSHPAFRSLTPRWKECDHQPQQMTLLAAMDAACDDITADACRGRSIKKCCVCLLSAVKLHRLLVECCRRRYIKDQIITYNMWQCGSQNNSNISQTLQRLSKKSVIWW